MAAWPGARAGPLFGRRPIGTTPLEPSRLVRPKWSALSPHLTCSLIGGQTSKLSACLRAQRRGEGGRREDEAGRGRAREGLFCPGGRRTPSGPRRGPLANPSKNYGITVPTASGRLARRAPRAGPSAPKGGPAGPRATRAKRRARQPRHEGWAWLAERGRAWRRGAPARCRCAGHRSRPVVAPGASKKRKRASAQRGGRVRARERAHRARSLRRSRACPGLTCEVEPARRRGRAREGDHRDAAEHDGHLQNCGLRGLSA